MKTVKIIRIIVSLAAMLAPAFAIVAGYDSVFARMQLMMAILSGSALWLLLWCLVTFIYGRIYCSAVCPLGTLQDCFSFVSRRCGSLRRGYRYRRPMPLMRPLVLAAVLLAMLGGVVIVPVMFDPYTSYARMVNEFIATPAGIVLGRPDVRLSLASFAVAFIELAVVALLAWTRGRLICNTVCPVGTLLGFISRRSLLHADINTDLCVGCRRCEEVCKAECIDLSVPAVDLSRCVVCFDCMAVCPNDAITYRSGRHRLSTPLAQPTAMFSSMPESSDSILKIEKLTEPYTRCSEKPGSAEKS